MIDQFQQMPRSMKIFVAVLCCISLLAVYFARATERKAAPLTI